MTPPQTCPHLAPLEGALAEQRIPLGKGGRSPYSDDGVWFPVDCTFDERSLRTRLGIGNNIIYEEYDGRVAGSDATWFCATCRRAIMGLHPRYAGSGTPQLR